MNTLHKITKQYTRIQNDQLSLYEQYARQHGINGKALSILLWIYYSQSGITQKRLADETYSSKQVINSVINGLKEKAFIYFVDSTRDKREKVVRLTLAGEHYCATLLDPLEQAEMNAMATLSNEQQIQLIELMSKYHLAFKAELHKNG